MTRVRIMCCHGMKNTFAEADRQTDRELANSYHENYGNSR